MARLKFKNPPVHKYRFQKKTQTKERDSEGDFM